MTNPTTTKDPVCGTDLEVLSAAERAEYNLQTYFFCSGECRKTFEVAPHEYARKTPPKPEQPAQK